ncbi:MAG: hypothetical protein HC910_08065 [Spirulinaceae cyanobacterium SM2_1_0]|nr:hypothetical protein [Spirulinaceae cyanobacterium SM2_1_0]
MPIQNPQASRIAGTQNPELKIPRSGTSNLLAGYFAAASLTAQNGDRGFWGLTEGIKLD